MRILVFLRASDYWRKRMLEDAEELISHFHFAPKKTLQTLHPFEIGDNYAAGIAQNVRNHKDLVPALLENQICFRCRRTIGRFSKNPTLQLPSMLHCNHAIDRLRNDHDPLPCGQL